MNTIELPPIIPTLYAQEKGPHFCYAVLESPALPWRWYVLETDGNGLCFGLVEGDATEYGYFDLNELESIGARVIENYPHGVPLIWVRETQE